MASFVERNDRLRDIAVKKATLRSNYPFCLNPAITQTSPQIKQTGSTPAPMKIVQLKLES